jgi:hypothetical protein
LDDRKERCRSQLRCFVDFCVDDIRHRNPHECGLAVP